MAYSASTAIPDRDGISLARAFVDRPQPVSVTINGFDYPGEVIFADLWQPWFGALLPERVMFRLVLLSEAQRVDRTDVTDRLIAIAVPGRGKPGNGSEEFAQLSREIGRLNEIRERYVTSTDSGLQALASSLVGKASDAQRSIAGVLAERWRRGQIVTSSENEAAITSDAIFIGDDSATWVEALAAGMFTHTGEAGFELDVSPPKVLFSRISGNGDLTWHADLDRRLQVASGAGLDQIIEAVRSLADGKNGAADGDALRALLLRRHRLPPGLASILVAAFIRIQNGEIALLIACTAGNLRIDRHSLSAATHDPDRIYVIEWLSDRQTGDWNSALPYIRTLLPPATPIANGTPDSQIETQLKQVIETLESRNALTLHTLNSVLGSAAESLPSVQTMRRLMPVLGESGWQAFYAAAVKAFPDAAEFTRAVTESSRLRTLCEDVVDVQAARDYVISADFGRADQALATDGELLIARLDVLDILAHRTPAAPVFHDFQQWKRRYTGVYRFHHAQRRSADLKLARRIKRADLQQVAVRKLTSIQELDGILDPDFPALWEELKESVEPCANREDELALQDRPFCGDCGVRMGSLSDEDEVEARIAQIEEMLQACSVRLSDIAVSRVLSGQREDELRKLIHMNSIADLTAISHVLDDGVMRFLKRFASGSPSNDSPGGND